MDLKRCMIPINFLLDVFIDLHMSNILSAPRHTYAGVLAFLSRFQPSSSEEESWLLCRFASTFGPTRSGTGMTHASGQALPLIRTLLDTLVCEPQARLRTFPGNDIRHSRGRTGSVWRKR